MCTMSPLQQAFIDKSTIALIKIKTDWILSLNLPAKEFVKKYYPTKQEDLDTRTSQFMNAMLEGVKEAILGIPGFGKRSLEITYEKDDINVTLKCLRQLAAPHLIALKEELDTLNPSIVDDIIQSNKAG